MGEQCSVCGVAVSGASVLYAPDGRIVCPACSSKLGPPLDASKPPWRMFAIAGVVVAAAPFAVHMSTSSSTTFNGEVTSFIYRDWIAIICGVVAVMLGGIAVIVARREQLRRALAIAAGVGVAALGAIQIARGFGVFEKPGGRGTSSTSFSIERTPEPAASPAAPKGDPKSPETCGDAKACFELGLALEKSDPASSTKAFERSCKLGAPGGCFNAGLDWTRHDPPGIEKATSLFTEACNVGHAAACNEIGRIAATGKKPDFARAKTMFEKACGAGDAQGCGNLGILFDNGKGVKQDLKKARELYEEGCKGSIANACYNLGVMRATGKGGAKDKAGAKAAYKDACDSGMKDACDAFARVK